MPELEEVLAELATLKQQVADQAEILAATANLQSEHAKLSELVADLQVKMKSQGGPGRMPKPTPKWHKLIEPGRETEREAEIGRLRGYYELIIPMLGGAQAHGIGPCWDKHVSSLMAMDVIAELYHTYFMGKRRPPSVLLTQSDLLVRQFPGLLQVMRDTTSKWCSNTEHLSLMHYGQGSAR